MDFLKSQFSHIPYPEKSFAGQTIIVTGSNTGLGLEAARHFARLGAARVIIAVRSIAKGEEAVKSINASTKTDVCEVWQVDVGNYKSITAFCERAKTLDRLDVCVENAGVFCTEFGTMEGVETTIMVNVLGTFFMALNLLPILRESSTKTGLVPTLVVVTSSLHFNAKFAERKEASIFEALKNEKTSKVSDRYNVSKLLEVFVGRSLAEAMQSGLHADQPVVLNCLCPGFCHSSLLRDFTGPIRVMISLFRLAVARTTEVGSRCLVAAASAGVDSNGKYMADAQMAPVSPFVKSPEGKHTQDRVYKELMSILESIQPGISQNV